MTVLRDTRARATMPVRLYATRAYISPSGRWCRWWPAQRCGADGGGELFLYHLPDGTAAPQLMGSDGFFISHANLHLMQQVGG
jgi:hypothetical protein